jgi:hypothetical protein
MKYTCERCRGRGWDKPKRRDAFPDACAWCRGAGMLRSNRLAKILHVPPRDVYRVERREPCATAGARIVDAIARYMPGVLSISTLAARVALVLP